MNGFAAINRPWITGLDSLVPAINASWMSDSDSLIPKIDQSWISSIDRLIPKIDQSWIFSIDSLIPRIDTEALIPRIDQSLLTSIDSLIPKIDTSWMSNFDLLIPKIDQSWIFSIDSLIPKIDTSWMSNFDSLIPKIDRSWFERLADLIHRRVHGLPSNWAEVFTTDVLDDEKLQSIILAEGIPLAWVPGPALIERLLAAEYASERRELIRNGWRGILRDCVGVCEKLPSRQARLHARFVASSARAIRDGHYEAAQALSANLVDTLGRTYVKARAVGYDWALVTSKNQRPKLPKLSMRALMVLGPLAVGHTDYRPDDLVPRAFSRHATAHGVSSRQYTKVNSLIALMNAAALLCWLERDSDAFVGT